MSARGRILDRRGIALAVVLLALVAIGLLIATAFLFARLERRAGDQTRFWVESAAASEAGLVHTLAGWDAFRFDSILVGQSLGLGYTGWSGRTRSLDSLLRIAPRIYLALSYGERLDAAGGVLARRGLSRLVRLEPPGIPVLGALTLRGQWLVTDSASVDGADSIPAGWGGVCPPVGPALPAAVTDTSSGAATFTQFGLTDFPHLLSNARVTVAGVASGIGPQVSGIPASCDRSSPLNWGEPADSTSPCFDYFPVIAAAAGTRISGGRGQGVLLSTGDLELTGGASFSGVVVVQGTVRVSGPGTLLLGTVLSANLASDTVLVSDGARIGFSRCAAGRALAAAGVPRPLAGRGWARLY